jgi:hypothetical protein
VQKFDISKMCRLLAKKNSRFFVKTVLKPFLKKFAIPQHSFLNSKRFYLLD